MDNILKIIESSFGQVGLRFTTAILIFYFALLGITRIYINIRNLITHRSKIETQRKLLELQKLHYEIEALKKSHGLSDIGVVEKTPDTATISGLKERPRYIDHFSLYLIKKGKWGIFTLCTICLFLEVTGTLTAGITLGASIMYLNHYILTIQHGSSYSFVSSDLKYILFISAMFSGVFLYYGVRRFGVALHSFSKIAATIILLISIAIGAIPLLGFTVETAQGQSKMWVILPLILFLILGFFLLYRWQNSSRPNPPIQPTANAAAD